MHTILVEEIHLLLDGTIDTRVACMQTDYQLSTVIKLFHQGKLLFESHGSRTAYGSTGFGTFCQFAGDETAGIKYQVGFFEKATSAYGDQLRIAGTGSDNFDVPLTYGGGVHGDGYSKVSAFLFGQE